MSSATTMMSARSASETGTRGNPGKASSPVNLPALTGTVTGFVGGDTLATATTSTALWTSNVTTGSFSGNYAINGSGLRADNYTFVQADGNATALLLQTVNVNVTDTPRVEPYLRLDGRNLGEIYPFEGGSIGIERSALFALLFAPTIEVIDKEYAQEEASASLPLNAALVTPDQDTRVSHRPLGIMQRPHRSPR